MITKTNSIIEGKHKKPILIDATFPSNKKALPIIIFCHGYKGFKDWGAWNIMAETFAKSRFCFIKFNFSHNGGTIEQPIDFPDLEAFGYNNYTKELDDLESVINWAFENDTIKNIGDLNTISLIGHSRGGGIVAIKAEEDSRIKNLISLASVCNYGERASMIENIEQWRIDGVKYVLNGRTKQHMPHYYQFYEDFIKNKKRLNIKRAVSLLKIPHLIIHGNQDTSVLVEESKKLHQWHAKSELKIIDGANHVFNAKHPWESKMLPETLQHVVDYCVAFINKI